VRTDCDAQISQAEGSLMGKPKKPSSIDDILAQAENPEFVRVSTARVLLRQDLHAEHQRLENELAAAVDRNRGDTTIGGEDTTAIVDQLRAVEAEVEDAKVEFRFKAIGRRAWLDLLAKHPPTREQLRARSTLDFNPDTFPTAAIAASCVEPEMTVDQVERLERALNSAQFEVLWGACISCNMEGVADPKSALAVLIAGSTPPVNGQSGTIAANTASPAVSSSAES
jgi:hypothetical protein